MQTFLNNGDEVVIFTPCFPIYNQQVELAGGVVNEVPYKFNGSRYVFDTEVLRAALKRPQTKLLLINSPSNPTGKVFSLEELQIITEILDECPHVIVINDAVYDFLVYDDHQHHVFANIGNNWERTITIYSGGKLINATGWKIGWVIANKKLMTLLNPITFALFISFNYPCQAAMGKAFHRFFAKGWTTVQDEKTGENIELSYVEATRH